MPRSSQLKWDRCRRQKKAIVDRSEQAYELADDSSAPTWLQREWDQRLTDEGLPTEITQIPRGYFGLLKDRQFCDNTALIDAEQAKPWGEQAINQRTQASDLEAFAAVDTASLSGEQRAVWSLYLTGIGERALSKHMKITRHRLWETWLGPIRLALGLPSRPSYAEYQRRYKGRNAR